MKNVVQLTILILGAFIGAGFSSGREVYVFFARFGWLSIPMALCVGVSLYVLFLYFLSLKPRKNTLVYKVFECVVICATFVLTATMFAGSAILGLVTTLLTLILALVQCFAPTLGLKLTNYIIVPLIFACTLLLAFLSKMGITVVGCAFEISTCAKYVGLNFVLLSMFLLELSDEYSPRDKKLAALISSIVITTFVIIISLVLMGEGDVVAKTNMPLVTLAFMHSRALGYTMSLVVWGGLATTLVSGQYVLFNKVQACTKNSHKLSSFCNVCVTIVCFCVSFVGWQILTDKVYSFLGGVCVVVIACEIFNEFVSARQKNRSG